MTARRIVAFVFVIDLGGSIQCFFQPIGTNQRRGAELCVNIAHFLGDIDVPFGRHLLLNQRLSEKRLKITRLRGLLGHWVQIRHRTVGHIRCNIIILLR
ncbi:hypothetical protein SDC9_112757 [bioreactor metagenome]|uniref:Uncharacterized protein n=1 Tax=bioreactor metagenome TaxID=1076179 RepID=A0A645BRK0_9ZZZZ